MQPLPLSLKVPALGLPLFLGCPRGKRDLSHQTTALGAPVALKSPLRVADSESMIISEEQALLAARYVEPHRASTRWAHPEIGPELMRRIVLALDATPETRIDRVSAAKARLATGFPEPREIAEMIVARAICDALR